MKKLVECSRCGYKISEEGNVCPHCGEDMAKIKRNNRWSGFKGYLLLLFILIPSILGIAVSFTNLQLSLWFALGVFVQSFFLLNRLNKKTIRKILVCAFLAFLLSSYVLAQDRGGNLWKDEGSVALILFCFSFSYIFYLFFRGEILYKINEYILAIWNAVFLYMYFLRFDFGDKLSFVVLPLAMISLIIVMVSKIPGFWSKLFLYCWFLFMMIFLAFYQFNFKIFAAFLKGTSSLSYTPLDAISTGMLFMYICSYSIFILILFILLIPLTSNRNEKFDFGKRKEEIKQHALILTDAYGNRQFNFLTILITFILVVLILMFNHMYNLLSEYTLINMILLASLYLFSKSRVAGRI